jgi:hypothetical protein
MGSMTDEEIKADLFDQVKLLQEENDLLRDIIEDSGIDADEMLEIKRSQ